MNTKFIQYICEIVQDISISDNC